MSEKGMGQVIGAGGWSGGRRQYDKSMRQLLAELGGLFAVLYPHRGRRSHRHTHTRDDDDDDLSRYRRKPGIVQQGR